MRRLIAAVVIIWMLVGCAAAPAAPTPTPTIAPPDFSFIDQLPADALLLQLDYEASASSWPELPEFARLIPFALYADGRAFYQSHTRSHSEYHATVMEAHLTPDQVKTVMQQMIDD